MSYSEVNSIILQRDAAESAAEVHGIATAMLCLDPATEANSWMTEAFFEDAHLLEDDKYALINLFDETKELLAGDEFLFDLFLPDEEAALALRCTALIQWCRGFLFGLGRASTSQQWSSDVKDIIKDIVEFTKLDADIEDDDDEAEGSMVEIQEYLRASTMLISTELSDIVKDVANKTTLH